LILHRSNHPCYIFFASVSIHINMPTKLCICHRWPMKMLYYLLACNCAINQYDSVSQVNDTDVV